MSGAAELQQRMAELLRRRKNLGKDEEACGFSEAHIGGNDRLSPVQQLEIYREQFWLRHTGSLVEDFPGLGGVIGQAAWERLVEEYLTLHAPQSFTLRDLGDRLPAFVESRTWLEERELATDMARLEWAHVEVFDADDAKKLDPAKLAAVPEAAWEGARLVPDPGLRLLAPSYPVVSLRRALLAARETNADVPLPEREPSFIAVHRREHRIHHDRLEPDEHALFVRIAAAAPLGKACESTAEALGTPVQALGERLEGWFASWARLGYVVDVVV
jgi:hypothetical protein